MIGKNKIKLIRSLELKKYRKETGLFVAEGPKLVEELFHTYKCDFIAATNSWALKNEKIINELMSQGTECMYVTDDELRRCSLQKSPQEVLALFRIRDNSEVSFKKAESDLVLALDGVQDPGNLGTIIRIADWFGIEQIFCSHDTADIYNPKTVQATMGAMARVNVQYCQLTDLFSELTQDIPVYGTFLDGQDIYGQKLSGNGIIVMGNEGKGISKEVSAFINKRLFIPNFPSNRTTSESLNVAVATAITCAEFRRQFSFGK